MIRCYISSLLLCSLYFTVSIPTKIHYVFHVLNLCVGSDPSKLVHQKFTGNMFLPNSNTASCGFSGRSDINLSIDVYVAPPSLISLRYFISSSMACSLRLFPSLSMNKLLQEGTKKPHSVCSCPSSHMFGKLSTLKAFGL